MGQQAMLLTRLQQRPLLTLSILACVACAILWWGISGLQLQLIESTAIGHAQAYSETLQEFRSLYTSEVVSTAKKEGLEVVHDYKTREGAIPLPATMTILLGQKIGQLQSGAETRLYSPYPFPWRQETGGLRDDFARDAWAALNGTPDTPFYRIEDHDGKKTLRYATADLMRSSCVHCHNTHPDTPKSDWKIGDVRGVLEVTLPLDSAVAQASSHTQEMVVTVVLILVPGLALLGLALTTIRRHAATLESTVEKRTRALAGEVDGHRKTEQELRQAKKAAEAADQAKSEFLANMSHEIRTPMTAILGFAENLADSTLSESEKLNCVHTIRRNGESLLGVINDILDLSKIEAGKMGAERVSCEPCSVIAEVATLVRVQAEGKGLPLHIEYDGSIPKTIHTDPARLRQILINLFGNAIKFTETGTVRLVTCLVDDDDDDEPCLQFDVIDTGQGMTEEETVRLFQPFVQADTSATRKIGGTGLGLTISKRFAELLGGDITVVVTEFGVGSTFRATVATGSLDGVKMLEDPMLATVVADDANTVAQAPRTDLHGLRILLAEDGPDNQRLISFFLKKAGVDVRIEENGQLALDAALEARDAGKPFDVILMDMQMPVMDGYEATGHLRQKGYTGPIIALTAHAMASDREKCIKAGCDDYATKPIDRKKLIETVQAHLVPAEAPTAAAT